MPGLLGLCFTESQHSSLISSQVGRTFGPIYTSVPKLHRNVARLLYEQASPCPKLSPRPWTPGPAGVGLETLGKRLQEHELPYGSFDYSPSCMEALGICAMPNSRSMIVMEVLRGKLTADRGQGPYQDGGLYSPDLALPCPKFSWCPADP